MRVCVCEGVAAWLAVRDPEVLGVPVAEGVAVGETLRVPVDEGVGVGDPLRVPVSELVGVPLAEALLLCDAV